MAGLGWTMVGVADLGWAMAKAMTTHGLALARHSKGWAAKDSPVTQLKSDGPSKIITVFNSVRWR